MKLLTGNKRLAGHELGSGDGAEGDAALLAKYPKIDGIISNYGTDALASVRAFQAAGRKLVPIATLEANGLSCLYKKNRHARCRRSRRATGSAGRGAQGDRRGRGAPEQRAEPLQAAVLRGHAHAASRSSATEAAAPDFYPSNQLTAADDQAVRQAVGRQPCRPPASFSASRTSSRRIPGVVALNGVRFEVLEGEVHALVGENGAGKSTLMAVAAGSTLPDSGSVEIGGRAAGPSPRPPPRRRSASRSSTSTSRFSRT